MNVVLFVLLAILGFLFVIHLLLWTSIKKDEHNSNHVNFVMKKITEAKTQKK
jgi:hypothetical protein